jgi:hypothetical protein
MQDVGSTGQSRSGSSSHGPTASQDIKLEDSGEAGSVKGILAGPLLESATRKLALRTSTDAARVKLETEETVEEPPRKRRKRRGIRDKRLSLNDDIMAIMLPYLAKISPRHVFLLSMLNHFHNNLVLDSNEIWRDMFKRWENKTYSRFSASQGSELAARALEAMPRWMIPQGNYQTELWKRGVRASIMRAPVGNPLLGSDWRTKGVPPQKQDDFGLFVRKCLSLVYIGCCGMCGTRQGQQRAVWGLNMRVCRGCWLDNIVSHRTLQQDYGISLIKPRSPGEEPLYRLFRKRVFYIRCFDSVASREKFTQDLADFPAGRASLPLWLIWKPHLKEIIDISKERAEFQARRAAGDRLSGIVKRVFAASLHKKFVGLQRSVQVQRVFALRHNEINRARTHVEFLDELESWNNSEHRNSMGLWADRMPEPWH